jgi:glycosyltransferase involved in cell wall biosynthesis
MVGSVAAEVSVKRKVLIVVENAPVPFDPRVWKEAVALHEAGHEVTILCPKDKGYERGHEVLEGIHIYRHPSPQIGNGAFGYVWEYGWALFWELLYSSWIYMRHGFDVIQGCNPPDDIFLVTWLFKPLGVKFIFDHHDVNPELYLAKYERRDFLYRILVWLEKMTFRSCDVVMSTNDSYKEIALTRGHMAAGDVYVVRNGPDLKTFQLVPKNPALKYGKRYLVGYVGAMGVQEGLDILVNVAEHIRNLGRREVQFTCVGDGPALTGLREMVKQKDIGEMINFTGRIPDADLLEILSTADVCVNPDKPCEMNDMSTMIKIMEYMALGKPIVQFDLREGRISAGEASLYSDNVNRVGDFAANILWLLDHPEERQRMGEFGRRRVEEHLAWEHSVPNLLAAYDRAFSKMRGKRALQTDTAGF